MRQGGVPGTSSNLPECQGQRLPAGPRIEPDFENGERHLRREQAGAAHHSASRADQAHCRGSVGRRCGGGGAEEQQRVGHPAQAYARGDETDRRVWRWRRWASTPNVATCWRWRTCRSRTCSRMRPLPPTMLEKVQRSLRQWTWLLRYAALACLFASVYLLLLRPVKKQL